MSVSYYVTNFPCYALNIMTLDFGVSHDIESLFFARPISQISLSEKAPSDYLRYVAETPSQLETIFRLLRTALTALYIHATFEPFKNTRMPNSTQLSDARMALTDRNTLFSTFVALFVSTFRLAAWNQILTRENLPSGTLRCIECKIVLHM